MKVERLLYEVYAEFKYKVCYKRDTSKTKWREQQTDWVKLLTGNSLTFGSSLEITASTPLLRQICSLTHRFYLKLKHDSRNKNELWRKRNQMRVTMYSKVHSLIHYNTVKRYHNCDFTTMKVWSMCFSFCNFLIFTLSLI